MKQHLEGDVDSYHMKYMEQKNNIMFRKVKVDEEEIIYMTQMRI